jgi:hypothetical protein
MSSPKLNPAVSEDHTESHDASQTGLRNEHQLVSALREMLQNPRNHTIGGLSDVVLHSLAELSLFKERVDLIAHEPDNGAPRMPTGSGSPSAMAVIDAKR